MKYRPDIDGLRAVAVIPVILFHAGLGISGGFVGVDIFFVISGYLITLVLLNDLEAQRFSIIHFYERRARRIFPALFFLIAVTSLVATAIMIPADLASYGSSVVASTAFVANIFFYFQEGYFTEAAELKPLLHTWSLGVEEQYYLVFPIFLWFVSRWLRPRYLFITLLICVVVSLYLSILTLDISPKAAFYLPHSRAWELLIGSMLAVAVFRGWLAKVSNHNRASSYLGVIGVTGILWAVFVYDRETEFPGLAALLPVIGTTFVIVSGAAQQPSIVSRVLSSPPFVFVGKISYSLYLWHWPLIAFAYYISGEISVWTGLCCAAASFVLAYFSWRYVENPFRQKSKFGRRQIFLGSAGSMAVIFAAGLVLDRTQGLPGRMSDDILELANTQDLLHDQRKCHFVTVERGRSGDVCIRGDTSALASFVFAGDSHADAFSPAVFAAAESMGISGYQYTNASFRPLPAVWMRGDQRFLENTQAFIEFVKARPHVQTVFLTGYWLHQMTGYTYRHEGAVFGDADYDGSGSSYNRTATINGLRRLAEEFPAIRIVLLDDVPTGYALHLKTQLRLMRFGIQPMGLPRSEADTQRQTYEVAFQQLAISYENVKYAPVFQGLCNSEFCPLFDGDIVLFRDGDHLSWQGALQLEAEARYLLSAGLKTP